MASRQTRHRVDLQTFTRTCETHKVAYATKAEALDGAERLMQMGHVLPGCHITPYVCRSCGRWHVYNRQIVFVTTE